MSFGGEFGKSRDYVPDRTPKKKMTELEEHHFREGLSYTSGFFRRAPARDRTYKVGHVRSVFGGNETAEEAAKSSAAAAAKAKAEASTPVNPGARQLPQLKVMTNTGKFDWNGFWELVKRPSPVSIGEQRFYGHGKFRAGVVFICMVGFAYAHPEHSYVGTFLNNQLSETVDPYLDFFREKVDAAERAAAVGSGIRAGAEKLEREEEMRAQSHRSLKM